ncbi:hypothetical protein T439DRAFT_376232 [Meredithblackwellia eburnea MCA 4105]
MSGERNLSVHARAISGYLCPVVQCLNTPELDTILARSNIDNVAHLLAPFHSSVEKLTVRSANLDPIHFNKFNLHFTIRNLPKTWNAITQGTPATSTHTHHSSPTAQSASQSGAAASNTTQQERDELFLDHIAQSIATSVDTWINQTGREELTVRKHFRPKHTFPDDEQQQQHQQQPTSSTEEGELEDEGWQGRPLDRLTPWYALLRDEVFRRRDMIPHDTFNWPVACVLALSTSNPDPLNALAALWDLTSPEKLFAPNAAGAGAGAQQGDEQSHKHEWANPEVLRYIVLVHDYGVGTGRDGWEDAQTLHETIRKTYGSHTALLPLFSASPTAMNPQPRARGVGALWEPFSSSSSSSPSNNPPASSSQQGLTPTVGLGVSSAGLLPDHTTTPAPPLSPTKPSIGTGDKGLELSDEDIVSLKLLLREFVSQSLVPFLERGVRVGNQQFVQSKRSIGGRLFSAGRKYFGSSGTSGGTGTGGGAGSAGSSTGNSSRTGSPVSGTGALGGWNAVKGFYPHQAQESQTRRLADLAFMLGDFKLAAEVYEQVSKDYRSDKAWKYYSSACRMAGLSHLLNHASAPLLHNPDLALEQANQVPLPPSGTVDLDALKATLLYYEAYRAVGDWRAAPSGLVRAAGESDEVASAILLEQAAIADLHLPMPSRRKFAFHMAMAATRYEKSGIKSLSRRCLSQAASVYYLPSSASPGSIVPTFSPRHLPPPGQTGWTAIRSHLHHSLAQQSYNVGQNLSAVEHFLNLLVGIEHRSFGYKNDGEESWLEDFGLAWEALGQVSVEERDRVVRERGVGLPVRVFEAKSAKIRVMQSGEMESGEGDAEVWTKLEKDVLEFGFEKSKRPAALLQGGIVNEVVVGETFYLELTARNPLDSPLAIGGLKIDTDAKEGTVIIEPPQEIELEPRQSQKIYVPVRATTLTNFSFTSLSYRFSDLLPCTESLSGPPKRLFATRDQLHTPTYAPSKALAVTVRTPIPVLVVSFDELPETLYAGEVRMVNLEITNAGQVPLVDLNCVCSHPSFAFFPSQQSTFYTPISAESSSTIRISNQLSPNTPFSIPLEQNTLQAGTSVKVPVVFRADMQGRHRFSWLFVFQGNDRTEFLTFKTSRLVEILPSLHIQPILRLSPSPASSYSISLHVQNDALPSEVVVHQISSVSAQWLCRPLDSFTAPDALGTLKQGHSTIVVLSASPVPDTEGAREGTEFAVRKLDALLQGKDVTTSTPGETVLHHGVLYSKASSVEIQAPSLLSSITRTHGQLRHRSLSGQLPTVSQSIHHNLFPLFNARSIDLIVFWSAPALGIQGHHHLADIPLGAGSNALVKVLETAEQKAGGLYAESQRERSMLLASLRRSELGVEENPAAVLQVVDEVVDHDFSTGPSVIKVDFVVRNLSSIEAFDYTLSLQSSDGSTGSILPPTKLPYAGLLTRTGTVPPLSSTVTGAFLWIARPGTYELGDWRVDATSRSSKWSRAGTRKPLLVRDLGEGAIKQ